MSLREFALRRGEIRGVPTRCSSLPRICTAADAHTDEFRIIGRHLFLLKGKRGVGHSLFCIVVVVVFSPVVVILCVLSLFLSLFFAVFAHFSLFSTVVVLVTCFLVACTVMWLPQIALQSGMSITVQQ